MSEPTAERRRDSTVYRFGHGIEVVLADDGEIAVQLWTNHEEAVLASADIGPSSLDRSANAAKVTKQLAEFTDELTAIRFWLRGKVQLPFREYGTVPNQTRPPHSLIPTSSGSRPAHGIPPPPRPAPHPSWTPSDPPWVIIPCSGAKAPGREPMPAVDRYTGSLFRAALATARRISEDRFIKIASARYGLEELTRPIEPYDRRLDALAREALYQWRSWVQVDACGMWAEWSSTGRPGAPAVLLVPKFYAEQLREASPLLRANAHAPFEDCAGIGEMRHVLATYTWDPDSHTPYIYSRGREMSRQEYEGNWTAEA